jgi:DNA transposition AAA+ family ATPase
MNEPIAFVQTRQHLRFAEFANYCRTSRSLGVCTGKPGVGKETSARFYSQWQAVEPLLENPRNPLTPPVRLLNCHTAYWDAEINCSLRNLRSSLRLLRNKFDAVVKDSLYWHEPERWRQPPRNDFMELLIVNNAHRLSFLCLEALNDFRKKYNLGAVLLGAPGFNRKVRLYDLVGSDVALYHEYSKPRSEELRQILELRWQNSAVKIEDMAITVIEEASSLNIQKALHIQSEIERFRGIDSISIISPAVVQAAGRSLLLDPAERSKK